MKNYLESENESKMKTGNLQKPTQINEKYGHFIHNFQEHSITVLFTLGTHLPTPGSFQDLKMLFKKKKVRRLLFLLLQYSD